MNTLPILTRLALLSVAGLCLLTPPVSVHAQNTVLLDITSPWRHTTNNLDGENWTATGYNDSTWAGPSNALLYIENAALPAPKNTPLPPKPGGGPMNTYYFRNRFTMTDQSGILSMTFSNLVDDGAVFYMNGSEIQRMGMNAGTVTNATLANFTVGDATNYTVFVLSGQDLTHLVAGTNVLAVEVHQVSTTSSDIVFGSAVSIAYDGPPVALTRGPYLQMSTPNSMVIRWRTDIATNSQVIFGTNMTSLNFTSQHSVAVTEHIVTLTNLQSDTRYFYAVGTVGTTLDGPDTNHFFLTHPLPGTPKPIRVWVIGDAGTANSNQQAVREAFEAFNGTNTVHAWLQLGDNAYNIGSDAEYQAAVFNMYSSLLRKSVTWPTLGNHDTAQSTAYVDTYPYFSIFTLPTAGEAGGVPSGTEHYYSFDLGMVHFICLDSTTADRSPSSAPDVTNMAAWLQSDLDMTTNRWIVAFWHHPPYTKGSHNSDTESSLIEMRQNFLPILEAAGVDLVLCGHSHAYERSCFINGHYGMSATFNTTMIVQPGNGRETNGVGAFLKPDGLGERPIGNKGAIYAVVGSSGQTSGGALDHPAMCSSTNVLGSMVLDFTSNRLDALSLNNAGATNDWFTIIKNGTYPPRMTTPMIFGDGFQFTVLTRAYRTNIVEATTNLSLPDSWTAIATHLATNMMFEVYDTNAFLFDTRFYRIRRR